MIVYYKFYLYVFSYEIKYKELYIIKLCPNPLQYYSYLLVYLIELNLVSLIFSFLKTLNFKYIYKYIKLSFMLRHKTAVMSVYIYIHLELNTDLFSGSLFPFCSSFTLLLNIFPLGYYIINSCKMLVILMK